MNRPVLVVMAAGMGSRYGGLKQVDPVGSHGQLIIDYSIYDARRAGFETVIFVIKHEIEDTFKTAIGNRLSRVIDVKYAYQQLDDIPKGYSVPEGRMETIVLFSVENCSTLDFSIPIVERFPSRTSSDSDER